MSPAGEVSAAGGAEREVRNLLAARARHGYEVIN